MTDTIQTYDLVTLAQMYRGDTVRQINRKTVLLKMIRVTRGEGKNIAWAPESGGIVAENYSEGVDPSVFAPDGQASAVLNWGLYRGNIHVSQLALDTSSTSADPLGNRALWGRNIANASARLATVLNTDAFSGAGTGTLLAGLDVAVATDDNTYATIDRSNSGNAYFRPTVIDPGTPTAVTFALLRDDLRKIYEACGASPDIALTTPTEFNVVVGLFDKTRRQIDNVLTAKGPIRLDFGMQACEVDGTVFMRDKDATAASIYYLNTDHVELQYLPSAEQERMLEAAGIEVEADDGFGEVPLGFMYEKLAKTGPAEKAEVLFTGNIVVDRPNSCGARLNAA